MRINFGIRWLCLILLLARIAYCQQPDMTRPPVPLRTEGLTALPSLQSTGSVARSWVQSNRWWISGFLALQAGDALATERDQSQLYHYERNPLIPHTTAGRAAYFVGTAGLVLGASWLAERRGHPKLAKWILRGACAVEAQANVMSWGKL